MKNDKNLNHVLFDAVVLKLRENVAVEHKHRSDGIRNLASRVQSISNGLHSMKPTEHKQVSVDVVDAYNEFFDLSGLNIEEYQSLVKGEFFAISDSSRDEEVSDFKVTVSSHLQTIMGILQIFLQLHSQLISSDAAEIGKLRNARAQWVPNPISSGEALHRQLNETIESMLVELSQSNSLAHLPELDGLRRENLVNSLRTILKMLEAPMVEASIIDDTKNDLEAIGEALKDEMVDQGKKKLVKDSIWALTQILVKVKDKLPDG